MCWRSPEQSQGGGARGWRAWSDAGSGAGRQGSGPAGRRAGLMAAGNGEVLLDFDGAVAVVTLNAPDRRNALTPQMATEGIEAFDEVDGRSDVGALVVRAVGKSFCAGGEVGTTTRAREGPPPAGHYKGQEQND